MRILLFQQIVKIPEFQNILKVPVFWKLMCTLKKEIVPDRRCDVWKCQCVIYREDRDAFNRAKQKEWTSWLDKEAVELVKDRLKVPRSYILCARWVLTWKNVGTEKVPKARMCALGFQDPRLTTFPTSSPTWTSDGGSAILQLIVNEGHLLVSGDLKTAFLSGDPDHAYKGSDALPTI